MLLLGLIIGAASGFVQFCLLAKFTKAATGGAMSKKAVLFGVCQFFLPIAVLLGCAFLLRDALLWAAVGMAAVLIIGAFVKFILTKKQGD